MKPSLGVRVAMFVADYTRRDWLEQFFDSPLKRGVRPIDATRAAPDDLAAPIDYEIRGYAADIVGAAHSIVGVEQDGKLVVVLTNKRRHRLGALIEIDC